MSAPTLAPVRNPATSSDAVANEVALLARQASLEVGVHDLQAMSAARPLLPSGASVFISHLPKQSFDATIAAAQTVRAAGFNPVPHVPVRLLPSERAANDFIARLRGEAQIDDALLISGDYASAVGPFSSVMQFLQTDVLQAQGLTRVSFAGHPEGHPKVPHEEIRTAELDKVRFANANGLDATLVTQFFFEARPFIEWACAVREQGLSVQISAGLAGPARLSALIKFAMRCGVGRSIGALTHRPGALSQLMVEHGPDDVLMALARARLATRCFDTIHLFSFGGFARTCEWLRQTRERSLGPST